MYITSKYVYMYKSIMLWNVVSVARVKRPTIKKEQLFYVYVFRMQDRKKDKIIIMCFYHNNHNHSHKVCGGAMNCIIPDSPSIIWMWACLWYSNLFHLICSVHIYDLCVNSISSMACNVYSVILMNVMYYYYYYVCCLLKHAT